MAFHSSTVARKIPWMEEPGRLQSIGSLRVRHDWATSLSLSTFIIGKGNGNPLQWSCLENPMDGEAWWAAVHGVAQSWTWLKWLSSSSSTFYADLWVFCIARYFLESLYFKNFGFSQPDCAFLEKTTTLNWTMISFGNNSTNEMHVN